jgi:hypothetical protein
MEYGNEYLLCPILHMKLGKTIPKPNPIASCLFYPFKFINNHFK